MNFILQEEKKKEREEKKRKEKEEKERKKKEKAAAEAKEKEKSSEEKPAESEPAKDTAETAAPPAAAPNGGEAPKTEVTASEQIIYKQQKSTSKQYQVLKFSLDSFFFLFFLFNKHLQFMVT